LGQAAHPGQATKQPTAMGIKVSALEDIVRDLIIEPA
jgi:hypothetical protein